MGGKNHQPCGKYLHNSTLLSLAMSQAGIAIEMANVHLEQTLLAEMPEGKAVIPEIDTFVNFPGAISVAMRKLVVVREGIARLRAQMKGLYYEDLPTIMSQQLDGFGDLLAKHGMVSATAYQAVLHTHRQGKFYAVLDLFDTELDTVIDAANALTAKAEISMEAAGNSRLLAELEQNGDGNLRPEFAALYTSWAKFNDLFLASSLLSTEAFYMHEGTGSLLDRVQKLQPITT